MGAVLRIHYFDNSTDEVHLDCEHPNTYWTWYVSEDGRWLIVKRFEHGMERTQVPMQNIKALVVLRCERTVGSSNGAERCQCGEQVIEFPLMFTTVDGTTHRSRHLGDVVCDKDKTAAAGG